MQAAKVSGSRKRKGSNISNAPPARRAQQPLPALNQIELESLSKLEHLRDSKHLIAFSISSALPVQPGRGSAQRPP